MKIRNGFVSNSSSSSYIVKIHDVTLENFAGFLQTEYWYNFNKESLLKKINTEIEELKKDIEKEKEEKEEEKKFCLKSTYEERLKQHLEYKEALGEIEEEDIVGLLMFYLKYHGIKIDNKIGGLNTKNKEGITLSCFTSMHNSFNEGMSDLLKEIVLFLAFDHNLTIECERGGNC